MSQRAEQLAVHAIGAAVAELCTARGIADAETQVLDVAKQLVSIRHRLSVIEALTMWEFFTHWHHSLCHGFTAASGGR